jgi:hypothetical protein
VLGALAIEESIQDLLVQGGALSGSICHDNNVPGPRVWSLFLDDSGQSWFLLEVRRGGRPLLRWPV